MKENYNLLLGDSKDRLQEIETNSIDLIVSDPPYGLSFMQKNWDKTLPDIKILRECKRILKNGHFAFWM